MYVTVKPSKSQLLTKYIKTKHVSYFIPFYHVCLVEQFPLKTHTHIPNWLVVSTQLKNISQIGNLPQIGMNIKKYLKPPPSQHQPSNHPTPWRSFLSESASDSIITTGLGVATGKGAGSKGESYISEHRGTSLGLDETKRGSRGFGFFCSGYLVNWFGWVSTVDVIQCYTYTLPWNWQLVSLSLKHGGWETIVMSYILSPGGAKHLFPSLSREKPKHGTCGQLSIEVPLNYLRFVDCSNY